MENCEILRQGRNIRVEMIHADNEFKLLITDDEYKYQLEMNFSAPEEYALDVEWGNRILQYRFIAGYYHLPFKVITWVMIWHLAMRCVRNVD